ncbi:hypothetical protein D3C75_889860 [compost metagenome]
MSRRQLSFHILQLLAEQPQLLGQDFQPLFFPGSLGGMEHKQAHNHIERQHEDQRRHISNAQLGRSPVQQRNHRRRHHGRGPQHQPHEGLPLPEALAPHHPEHLDKKQQRYADGYSLNPVHATSSSFPLDLVYATRRSREKTVTLVM